MTNFIVFAGRKYSGKTTAASWIDSRGYHPMSLANPLKVAARELFCLTDMQIWGPGKDIVDPAWDMAPRDMLQKLGTEGLRVLFGEDFHLRRLELEVKQEEYSHVVVDDCRFPNEAQWFKDRGALVIGVHRPALDHLPADNHKSEQFADLEVLRANCDAIVVNPAPLVGLSNHFHRPPFLEAVIAAAEGKVTLMPSDINLEDV